MTTPKPFTPPHPLNTAVLFLVFNRLDTTKQVFEAIRQAKPPRLYVAADGAREIKEGEAEKVQAVRDYVMQNIDWECEVKTLFRDQNLGCKYAVSGAITWFFENEEQGIILEDDCLPSQSFFWYCEELLERYKDNNDVCSISGNLRENQRIEIDSEDVFKSKFFNMWGWATWRRQWKKYDVEVFANHKISVNDFKYISNKKEVFCYWNRIYNFMMNYEKNTIWDYQMTFLSFESHQYNVYPRVNLVKNLGFGIEATHTFDKNSIIANIELIDVEIKNTSKPIDELVCIDSFFYNEYSCKTLLRRIINKIKRFVG